MNRYTSLQPVVVLWSAVLFLSACTTPAVPSATPIPPTATPITQAGSRILHNNTWGFGSSVTFDRFTQDASGELVAITGDISIDFALLDPPALITNVTMIAYSTAYLINPPWRIGEAF